MLLTGQKNRTTSVSCSAAAVYEADKARHRSPTPINDFRLSGPTIPATADDIFVNIDFYRKATPSTGSSRSGRPYRPKSTAIRWLTTQNEVIALLQNAFSTIGPLNDLNVFRELIAALGLKANDSNPAQPGEYDCGVNLFHLRTGGKLNRPNALSTGYEDRFCGVSPLKPFGSTADNRSGKSGLPEAVASETDLIRVEPSNFDYKSFKTSMSKFAPWLKTSDGWIEAVVDGPSLFTGHLPYSKLRPILLRRLGQKLENCGPATSSCYCSTGGSPYCSTGGSP